MTINSGSTVMYYTATNLTFERSRFHLTAPVGIQIIRPFHLMYFSNMTSKRAVIAKLFRAQSTLKY